MSRWAALLIATALLWTAPVAASGPLLAGGYHLFTPSPYLDELARFVDVGPLNALQLELGWRQSLTTRLSVDARATYRRSEISKSRNNAQLDLRWEATSALFSLRAAPLERFWITPLVDAGVGVHYLRSNLDYTTRGQGIESGCCSNSGLGLHAAAGVLLRPGRWLNIELLYRRSWVPLYNFAGSGRVFDVGGRTLLLELLLSLR